MRQGMTSRQKYLQHVALAFVAGGVLTYVCVNLMGHAGTIDAKGEASLTNAAHKSILPDC